MAKDHKYSKSRIEATTSLAVPEVMDLVKAVAADTTVSGFKYNNKVRLHLVEESDGELKFDVAHKYPLLIRTSDFRRDVQTPRRSG
jgi:hypothetical protein